VADAEIVWPVGTSDRDPDLGDRPMVFDATGFLAAILPDVDEAGRAAAALRAAGFADRELRVFSSEQILEDRARYTAQRGLTRRAVAALTEDEDTIALYYGHARDGRAALWVHTPDDDAAKRAIRALADSPTLHIRHYGHRRQSDFVLRHPTSDQQVDDGGGRSR
jgi:hypothetical protein